MSPHLGMWKETELPPNPYARKTTLAWMGFVSTHIVVTTAILPPVLYHSRTLNKLFILLAISLGVYRCGVYNIRAMKKGETGGQKET